GLLSAEQTASLLAQRDDDLRRRVSKSRISAAETPQPENVSNDTSAMALAGAAEPDEAASWRAASDLRREVNRLIAVIAARTGKPHGALHAQLRSAVPGPASASAPASVLEARREHLMRQL
ncbi:MAG: type restriction protein res subunit, partial [Pseudonocardiales bacterium]|nr:type restriction protein res subunit [Pseudonocardiales bacterium]